MNRTSSIKQKKFNKNKFNKIEHIQQIQQKRKEIRIEKSLCNSLISWLRFAFSLRYLLSNGFFQSIFLLYYCFTVHSEIYMMFVVFLRKKWLIFLIPLSWAWPGLVLLGYQSSWIEGCSHLLSAIKFKQWINDACKLSLLRIFFSPHAIIIHCIECSLYNALLIMCWEGSPI